MTTSLTFGPIPSRRLGRSLGVNNIPPKACSYSCVYCQVGATPHTSLARRTFYDPAEVVAAVRRKIEECLAEGVGIDYVSFVPDGEPTLDVNLGAEIRGLKGCGLPIAVITNGSLLWRADVAEDLAEADLVSIEVDTVSDTAWRRIDRPSPDLDPALVRKGMLAFAKGYRGELITQSMLVAGLNDDEESINELAGFLAQLAPRRAYLAVPTRPPADPRVSRPEEDALVRAYAIFSEKLPSVEVLAGHETGAFGRVGDAVEELMATLAVHPMREDVVARYLSDSGSGLDVVDGLVQAGRLARVEFGGEVFVARRFEGVR